MSERGLRKALAPVLGVWLACGPTGTAPVTETRLISLSPSITRVLLHLGLQREIVAVDRFSRGVPGLGDVPSLGGLFSPDIERTLELRPSMVLAVRSVQQADFVGQLRARGIPVHEIEVYTLEEVLQSFLDIGRYVDRRREAAALVAGVRAELARVARSVEGRPRPRVALVLERDPLYVAGGGAFIHDLIEIAGGENVFADLPAPYPRVSLELLAERAPDLVLDTSRGPDAGSEAMAEVQRYWSRSVWVQRAEPFPPGAATLPAPDLAEGARLLRARIHPGMPAERPPGEAGRFGSRAGPVAGAP